MIEVNSPKPKEIIEKMGNVTEVFGVKSCKTYRSYLENRMRYFERQNDITIAAILQGLLQAYNHFHPIEKEDNYKLELEIIDGWKGKGDARVYLGFDNNFRVKEHIKDKATGKVSERIIEVLKEDLNRMIGIIKNLELNKEYSCYEIANSLGWDWKNLWKERKLYFKQYYFPIKVLEALKVISYGGRGNIARLI